MHIERKNRTLRGAWYVTFLFFIFVVLHYADKYLISPLLPIIRSEFKVGYTELGAIETGTIIVAVIFMPLWGYLFDKYKRPPLVALASTIWGSTTIFSTFSRNYVELITTRSITGIDNQATSGLMSFLGDYFPPEKRAMALGILQAAETFGALIGVIIGLVIGISFGWRNAFLVTAIPGILLAAIILFTVKDVPRGGTEPELVSVRDKLKETFSIDSMKQLLKRRSVLFLYLQGFFGVFPWNILSYWLFTYMTDVRAFDPDSQLLVMLAALIAMVIGNISAGIIGDWSFRRSKRGRIVFATLTVIIGLVFFNMAFLIKGGLEFFLILGALTALFMPMAGPCVSSSVQDVALPEIRGSSMAMLLFFYNVGSAFAPLITGYIADLIGLEWGIVAIVNITWSICIILLSTAALFISRDIEWKKSVLEERARILVSKEA
ncbi:MAG: MFS transporter [Nitrososphaerota archaeon]|nr:MFS transporter [Nitrososphaerota archaeon]